jgi:hypothetical protein
VPYLVYLTRLNASQLHNGRALPISVGRGRIGGAGTWFVLVGLWGLFIGKWKDNPVEGTIGIIVCIKGANPAADYTVLLTHLDWNVRIHVVHVDRSGRKMPDGQRVGLVKTHQSYYMASPLRPIACTHKNGKTRIKVRMDAVSQSLGFCRR